MQSGWFVPGNGKSLVKLRSESGTTLIAASQNKGPLKLFQMKKATTSFSLQPNDVSVLVNYRDGRKQRREVNYGASFLSQSGRFINVDGTISFIEINDSRGKTRTVKF
jgi:hypothetical protein